MANNRIYIPTFISSINYNPARVLPRIYFYNGTKTTDAYYIQGYQSGSTTAIESREFGVFPYFDNYSGNTPDTGSRSLLFNNETAAYGVAPSASLYTEYWEDYVSLLYNPKTRLLDCSAIIPLADYFKMELNDIVEFRGNYYHLRAINNYNLRTSECDLQLLGPVLPNAIQAALPPSLDCSFDITVDSFNTTTTTTTSTSTTTTTLAPTTTTTSTTSTTSTTTAAPTTTTTTPAPTSTTTTLAPTTTTTSTTSTTSTTTIAPTTTTTTLAESCISASLNGALSGSFVSGGFAWNYLDFYSSVGNAITETLSITSGYTQQAKLLLIGGGGGGAYSQGGGSYGNGGAGGAGQVVYVDTLTISSGSYNIVVNAGGGGGDYSARTQGINGYASTALGYTANGGGGGGGAFPTNAGRSVTGGSGGGGGAGGAGGTGTFNGGSNAGGTGGGGGGGASANGTNGPSGIGGAGLTFNLTGTSIDVGGGGNGGNSGASGGNSGAYGGGRGTRSSQTATDGVDGTGGGAGGGSNGGAATARGGSGRFILVWKSCVQPTTSTTTTTTNSPGGNCYVFTFTAGSGTQTATYKLCGETETTTTSVTAGTPLVVCCYEDGKGITGIGSSITQGAACSPATTTTTTTAAPTTTTTTVAPTTTTTTAAPTTTTTTVAPTTTTTTNAFDFYTADEYDCNGCTLTGPTPVKFPAGTSVTIGKYYRTNPNTAYSYLITATTTGTFGLLMDTVAYDSCYLACGGTTTTTTTAAPTTTTTTTAAPTTTTTTTVAPTTTTTTVAPTTTTTTVAPTTTTTTTQAPTTTTTTTTTAPTTTTTTTTAAPTTTTTTVAFYSFLLNSTNGLGTGPAACADYAANNRQTYYSSFANGPTIVNGTFLYTDSALTTAIPDGYRSDGTTYWNFQGGDTGDNGNPCNTTTTTSTSTTTTTTVAPTTTTTTTAAPLTTYYELDDCVGTDYAFTAIAPDLGTGQRYVLPGSRSNCCCRSCWCYGCSCRCRSCCSGLTYWR